MALIDQIRPRIGVFYSEKTKDQEIEQMIGAAKQYFKNAGWTIKGTDHLAIEAIALFCKMAQSTDPAQMKHNPVLISYIVQGRSKDGSAEVQPDDAG